MVDRARHAAHLHGLLVIEKLGEFGELLADQGWSDAGPAGY